MTSEELEQFTDIMMRKAAFGFGFVDGRYHWAPGEEAESFRSLIQNVIIDTEMLVDGSVPLEQWLEEVAL